MTASPSGDSEFNFGDYPRDFFDLIIVDECHRGGSRDESSWRGILDYFEPAVQIGLTATPKRKDNVDTYQYFGEPVYQYSLKEGVNDGFLTPFKVKRIHTTMDDYRYSADDKVIEGDIDEGKLYEQKDFNRTIEIKEREAKRVKIYLDDCDQREKAIIFCATQEHAAMVRDLVNQYTSQKDPFYCVRVTANDGAEGERLLREFQDNEKTIPTILTTSQKLSTGVDARNIRNIVLMRPVNSMIEFNRLLVGEHVCSRERSSSPSTILWMPTNIFQTPSGMENRKFRYLQPPKEVVVENAVEAPVNPDLKRLK
jgi:type I restriction enzyme R subunit